MRQHHLHVLLDAGEAPTLHAHQEVADLQHTRISVADVSKTPSSRDKQGNITSLDTAEKLTQMPQ